MFLIGLSCGFSLAVVVWAMSVAYNTCSAQPINNRPRVLGRGMNESLLLLQEAERIVNNR